MNLTWEDDEPLVRNQQDLDARALMPYCGTWIVFDKEGNEVLAHSAISREDLCLQPQKGDRDPNDHLITYVEGPGNVVDRGLFVTRGHPAATDVPLTGRPPLAG